MPLAYEQPPKHLENLLRITHGVQDYHRWLINHADGRDILRQYRTTMQPRAADAGASTSLADQMHNITKDIQASVELYENLAQAAYKQRLTVLDAHYRDLDALPITEEAQITRAGLKKQHEQMQQHLARAKELTENLGNYSYALSEEVSQCHDALSAGVQDIMVPSSHYGIPGRARDLADALQVAAHEMSYLPSGFEAGPLVKQEALFLQKILATHVVDLCRWLHRHAPELDPAVSKPLPFGAPLSTIRKDSIENDRFVGRVPAVTQKEMPAVLASHPEITSLAAWKKNHPPVDGGKGRG